MISAHNLTEAQRSALRSLVDVWPESPLCLVGGAALQSQYETFWRYTEDLDLAVAADIDDLRRLQGRPGWRQHPAMEQRWRGPGDTMVDLIPAGPSLLRAGEIIWPNSEFRMNLVGFRLAFAKALPLRLGPHQTIGIAPPEVIGVLKMIAYLDRPDSRSRDLADIAHLLEEYLPPDDDRRFSEEMLDAGISYHATAAFALGRDIGAICNDEEHSLVRAWLAKVRAAEGLAGPGILPQRWPDDGSAWFLELLSTFERAFTQPPERTRSTSPPKSISPMVPMGPREEPPRGPER